MIPGSNLLKMALTIIAPQTVSYYKYLNKSVNSIGVSVPVYATPVVLRGSFQPVPKALYEQYGLDLQKTYATFYSLKNLLDVQRDISSDRLVFNSQLYQCESNNDWFAQDGWVGVLCVLIDNSNLALFGFDNVNKNFENGGLGA